MRGRTPMTPQRWAFAVKKHKAILNALQRRDGAGLSHILRAHLRHKREEVLQAGLPRRKETTSRCGSREAGLPGEHSFISRLAFTPLRCDNRLEDRS
ncbi:hypothetical protein ABIF68_006588 [Bradyrhizobium japonicum]